MRDGHDAGFTELYLRHKGVARRVASTYRRQGDPDDLVNEAFEKVFAALRRGNGPTGSFRAYLLVTLRRLAGERAVRNDEEPFDDVPEPIAAARGLPLAAEERELINSAFESLPDRAQAVLWYTAVEGRHPRELSSLFGMTANAVSALAYRAREQLRQAYLQAHLRAKAKPQCEPHRSGLGAYVRNGQSRRDRMRTERHVKDCPSCRNLVTELDEVNRLLARAFFPLFLIEPGQHLTALAAAAGGAAGAGARKVPTALGWLKAAAPAAGGMAAAAALVGLGSTAFSHLRHDTHDRVDVAPAETAAAPEGPAAGPATPATTAPPPAAAPVADRTCSTPGQAAASPSTAATGTGSAAPAASDVNVDADADATSEPTGTTGLSLDLPLLSPLGLPVDDVVDTSEPVLALDDPVCTVDPDGGHGELTLAVQQGPSTGTDATAPDDPATTPPLVDVEAAGVELTVELSGGALAVDAQLPAGCQVLDGGITIRCTVDEALLGSETTLGLDLLGDDGGVATVSLQQGDQTIDVEAVELLGDVTGSLLPSPTAGDPAQGAAPPPGAPPLAAP